MRVALLLCFAASTTAIAAPIGETRYRLEGVHSFSVADPPWGDTPTRTSTFADGEHLIRAGMIFQRVALRPYAEQRFELLEFGLPMSPVVDVERYGGALRLLEDEGTLWTPEGDARVRLTEDDRVAWFSMAQAGDFLVCGGHGARFATLRPEPGGDLAIVELEQHTSNAWMMAGDRYGGFYYATVSSLHGAYVDSAGHVEVTGTSYGGWTSTVESSPDLDRIYAAQDGAIVLYRVEAPGRLDRVGTLQERDSTRNLAVWFDAERRVDRVAVTYEDSLFAFEVDESGASTLLFAEGDSISANRCIFLESGHLYYANGYDRAWLRYGASLERRSEVPLVQYITHGLTIAPDGDAWAQFSPGVLSYGTNMGAGLAAPEQVRVDGGHQYQVALSETHIYTLGYDLSRDPWLFVFERGDSIALVDSVAIPSPYLATQSAQVVDWVVDRGFLVTRDPVFDLSDPVRPNLIGGFSDHLFYSGRQRAVRAFPDSETDLLAAVETELHDIVSFFRISRSDGIEKIHDQRVDDGVPIAFDDSRPLLYRSEFSFFESYSVSIAVYDVSDPYQPLKIHAQHFLNGGPASRGVSGLITQDGILHVSTYNAQLFYNYRFELTPIWFDGARFVPAGASLSVPMFPRGTSGQAGYLPMVLSSAALLTYDPPPLPRREECCWSDGGPPPF